MQDLKNRLERMHKHWAKWARRRNITCYRVYDRDIPEYPFIAEVFEDHLVLTEMSNDALQARPNYAQWKQQVQEIFCAVLGIDSNKLHVKSRFRRGAGEQYEKLTEGDAVIVNEGGLKFITYPDNWLDVGLFLDHRNLRGTTRDTVNGKNFLNLFCYTGSFSVYAAAGGASLVHNVDLSQRYLGIAEENLSLNQLKPAKLQSFRSDARAFLSTAPENFYDLIVCDAPVFSKSRKQERDFDVLRDHPQLVRDALRCLKPDGILYFSTNFRKFKIQFPETGDRAAVIDITARTIPEDFRNKRIHTCYEIKHLKA